MTGTFDDGHEEGGSFIPAPRQPATVDNTDGRVMLWTVDDSGDLALASFGPYSYPSVGNEPPVNLWSAASLATGPDGLREIL